MPDPATSLTAAKLVELAFIKFIEGGAVSLSVKFTEAAVPIIDEMCKKIWEKLSKASSPNTGNENPC